MKKRKLKIGNYVLVDGSPVVVLSLTATNMQCKKGDNILVAGYNTVLPIEINEDYLDSFGYKRIYDTQEWRKNRIVVTKVSDGWKFYWSDFGYTIDIKIKYIHELQQISEFVKE